MAWFVVSAATWRATLQRRLTCLDRGQADNSTLCTFRRVCIELKKQKKQKQEHQPILQQIDSTCVLCLRDTLQMTNKQNETKTPDLAGTLQEEAEVCGKAQDFTESREVNTTC